MQRSLAGSTPPTGVCGGGAWPWAVCAACYADAMSEADIVVTDRGRRLLVIEVKRRGSIEDAKVQMARYMSSLLYPVGMIVTDREVAILRRDYESAEPIVEVARGEVSRIPLLAVAGVGAGAASEESVQRWVESLRDPAAVERLDEPLRSAIADWVVPALQVGEVRAAGPRRRRTNAG